MVLLLFLISERLQEQYKINDCSAASLNTYSNSSCYLIQNNTFLWDTHSTHTSSRDKDIYSFLNFVSLSLDSWWMYNTPLLGMKQREKTNLHKA